jgi:hypothetical protein
MRNIVPGNKKKKIFMTDAAFAYYTWALMSTTPPGGRE